MAESVEEDPEDEEDASEEVAEDVAEEEEGTEVVAETREGDVEDCCEDVSTEAEEVGKVGSDEEDREEEDELRDGMAETVVRVIALLVAVISDDDVNEVVVGACLTSFGFEKKSAARGPRFRFESSPSRE
jgi:hypothetical protein